jgi:hypothetical protein
MTYKTLLKYTTNGHVCSIPSLIMAVKCDHFRGISEMSLLSLINY